MEDNQKTILIIDDSPFIHKIVQGALGFKYNVISYLSGKDAIDKMSEIKPDIILLDLVMREFNGFDTIIALKGNEDTKDIPVLFLTSKNDVEFQRKAFELGAADYINKPFSVNLLSNRVQAHLAKAFLDNQSKEI